MNFDRCTVKCEYCGARYNEIVCDDEIPLFCHKCITPSLRVIERIPVKIEFTYAG